MFWNLFARYMAAISRLPRLLSCRSDQDRGDDQAADVDVRLHVVAGVADEGGRRDRGRQAAVSDLACSACTSRGCGDVDLAGLARRLGLVGQCGTGSAPGLALAPKAPPPSTPRAMATASRMGPSVFFARIRGVVQKILDVPKPMAASRTGGPGSTRASIAACTG